MQELTAGASFDASKFPEFLDENDHLVTLRKCSLARKRLFPEGDAVTLNIGEAVALLAPSRARTAKMNVLKLKTGYYVGVKSKDLSNFVIVNPTSDGDIRWLLRKSPDFPETIRDIYLVESVTIRRNAIDLPMEDVNGD